MPGEGYLRPVVKFIHEFRLSPPVLGMPGGGQEHRLRTDDNTTGPWVSADSDAFLGRPIVMGGEFYAAVSYGSDVVKVYRVTSEQAERKL